MCGGGRGLIKCLPCPAGGKSESVGSCGWVGNVVSVARVMFRKFWVLALVCGIVAPGAIANAQQLQQGQRVQGQVVSVGDGDTIRVRVGSQALTVRLLCIDSPESDQEGGSQATNRLRSLLPRNQSVQLRQVGRDRYGRTLAEVYSGGRSVNLQMVREGYAVAYRQYLSNCDQGQYLQAEAAAKASRLQFWSQQNPIMPWDYRRGNR